MSWHYSQALVVEFSERTCLDSDQCAQLKSNRMREKSCFDDKRTKSYRRFLSGMTFERSTENLGVESWMSSLRGSRVNRSPLPDHKKEATTNETGGQIQSESFAKWDQNSRCWKMSRALFDLTISAKSSETWQRQGLMLSGELYQQKKRARRTRESGCGYSLPTPTCYPEMPNKKANTNGPKNLLEVAKGDWNHIWPTPTAHMAKECNSPSEANRNQPSLSSMVGGKLNPTWVEWLMGWPIGWTDLKPLGMDKFQQWLQQHGICSQVNSNKIHKQKERNKNE